VSSPVPATSVSPEQVNAVHNSTVEDVSAPPTAHAEPNGFDEFDPRGAVPGIVCSFSAVNTSLM
jgi:epsin